MKSFGKNNCKLPSHPPQLVNTDYQKRIEQYESALNNMIQEIGVYKKEIERRDKMINELATSTASSIDIETVKKIIKDVSEKELRERAKKIELRELEAQVMLEDRLRQEEEHKAKEAEEFKELIEDRLRQQEEQKAKETENFKELMEEHKHSLEVIQNGVNSFEDIMKRSIKQPEPSYLKPTKLSESRKEEIVSKKKKGK